jgi:predicted ATPase
VDALLRAAPDVRILATSREPLGVYGEALYDVGPLESPDADESFPEESLANEAVRLFADRASLVDNSFAASDDVASLVRICRTVEGIPLAIELAAALVREARPSEIADRIDDRFATLRSGPRTAPERQRTLRATIDWSYDLLTEDERRLFERLSVFVGGATADAAARVAGYEPLAADEVLELLERLVRRSLVAVDEANGERRYRMLDTVRAYAAERASSEIDALRLRHAGWAASLGTELGQRMNGPDQPVAVRLYEAEQDNARAATAYAIASRNEALATPLVLNIFHLWIIRGQYREGRAQIAAFLDAFPGSAARARAFALDGQLAAATGNMTDAIPALEESVALARAAKDRSTLTVSLNQLAAAAVQTGRLDDATAYASEAVTLARVAGLDRNMAQSLNILGVAAAIKGDEQAAYGYYEDALAISRETGMRENIARLLMNLGNISLGRRDYDRAREYYREARGNALEIGDAAGASGALSNLGAVAKAVGDLTAARAHFEEALEEKTRIGDGRGLTVALHGIADVERRDGRFTEARAAIARCIEVCRDMSFTMGSIQSLEAAVSICADAGDDPVPSVRMGAAADAARTAASIPRNDEDTAEFDRALGILRSSIGAQAFDEAWTAGATTALDEAANDAVAFLRSR